jgi:hypothetical protein
MSKKTIPRNLLNATDHYITKHENTVETKRQVLKNSTERTT